MHHSYVARSPAAGCETTRLLEEIETLEQRLHTMGEDGDCAYERAMSAVYKSLVEQRRQQLTLLMRSPRA